MGRPKKSVTAKKATVSKSTKKVTGAKKAPVAKVEKPEVIEDVKVEAVEVKTEVKVEEPKIGKIKVHNTSNLTYSAYDEKIDAGEVKELSYNAGKHLLDRFGKFIKQA